MNLGRLIARVTVGTLFAGHGTQKLFGWFGGPGVEGASQMMHKLNLHPGRRNAVAAGVAETTGGALLALGALTPLAGALITSTMTTAIRKVHFKQGLWNAGGGFEYNLVLISAVAAIVAEGPGSISLDAVAGRRRWGPLWGLAAVAAGIVGSTAVVELGHRAADVSDDLSAAPEAGSASGGDAVTDSADAARAQGLDPAETADAAI